MIHIKKPEESLTTIYVKAEDFIFGECPEFGIPVDKGGHKTYFYFPFILTTQSNFKKGEFTLEPFKHLDPKIKESLEGFFSKESKDLEWDRRERIYRTLHNVKVGNTTPEKALHIIFELLNIE